MSRQPQLVRGTRVHASQETKMKMKSISFAAAFALASTAALA
jgi:hypothetical protein